NASYFDIPVAVRGSVPPGVAVGRAMGLGEPGGCPSRGAWAFLPPLLSPGQRGDRGLSPFHSARHPLAVPAPARGSRSSSSALPNLLRSTSMATETEWSCPICGDARDDVSYAMPCRHQFCLGCILRWTEVKPECPLCRRPVENVRFSVLGEDDYLQCVVAHPEESPDASRQAGSAPGPLPENSPHHPCGVPSVISAVDTVPG
uniref:RING-type E3 ubiquitin transferase n=1 Tax=Aquila chrysaetos chrysaetos TaxID=223781 RepID=A0A663FHI0_AQUCH